MKNTIVEVELPPISIIIPAYNEEKWISTTVSSILKSGFPCEVIVVNDGSTDTTSETLAKFGDPVKVISHKTNRGKGLALVSGIREATGVIIVFCDAHLLGLNYYHLLSLVLPLVLGLAKASLGKGITEELSVTSAIAPSLILTGQRAYFREDLIPLLNEIESLGYGVETFLYNRFSHDKTFGLLLPGLTHLLKKTTSSPTDATREYLREVSEILETLARLEVIKHSEFTEIREAFESLLSKLRNRHHGDENKE